MSDQPSRLLLDASEEDFSYSDLVRGKFILTWREPTTERRELRRLRGNGIAVDVPSYQYRKEEWAYESAEERGALLPVIKTMLAEAGRR